MTLQPCPFRAESDKPWQNSGCTETFLKTIYVRNIRNEVTGCSDIYWPHHALFMFPGIWFFNASIQLAFRMAFTFEKRIPFLSVGDVAHIKISSQPSPFQQPVNTIAANYNFEKKGVPN